MPQFHGVRNNETETQAEARQQEVRIVDVHAVHVSLAKPLTRWASIRFRGSNAASVKRRSAPWIASLFKALQRGACCKKGENRSRLRSVLGSQIKGGGLPVE